MNQTEKEIRRNSFYIDNDQTWNGDDVPPIMELSFNTEIKCDADKKLNLRLHLRVTKASIKNRKFELIELTRYLKPRSGRGVEKDIATARS